MNNQSIITSERVKSSWTRIRQEVGFGLGGGFETIDSCVEIELCFKKKLQKHV